MPTVGVHADLEGSQKRWIIGALAVAFVAHLVLAWALGLYKIPGMEIPSNHSQYTGPFTVKQIEINPDAFKSQQSDSVNRMPVVEPPQNPSQFNLDPSLVEKALQTPQPSLSTPEMPEASKVIAASDLSQGVPFVESDSAKISAEVERVDPTTSSPLTTAKLAQDVINGTSGPPQSGILSGTPVTGNGTAGTLPGFADLAPTFRATNAMAANLPDPVLLRLPSDVLFDFDSATLKPDADPLLSKAVGMITKYPQADIQIDGYSDSFGKLDYNTTLSQQRSEAVLAWFQAHTTQGGYKFHAKGHGSTNFVVSPQGSIDQQQPNRRVEILIQALKQ